MGEVIVTAGVVAAYGRDDSHVLGQGPGDAYLSHQGMYLGTNTYVLGQARPGKRTVDANYLGAYLGT